MGVPIALMRTWGLPPMSTPGYHRWQLHNLPWPVDHFTKKMDSDSSKPFSRPSLGTRGCYHKAVNWNTKRGETVVKNFKVGLVWLHTGCFSNCSSRFSVPTWKKSYTRRRYWCFGVRYTGNSREQDRPRDRSLSGPSVRWLLIICGCCQKCRHPCYSYFAVVFVFGVGVAVIVFVSLLLLLMTSMTSSRHDNDKAKNDHILIWWKLLH